MPIARDAIGVVSPFQTMTAFSSTHVMVISMAAVEPGCAVDWEYVMTTKASLMRNRLWDEAFFSDGHPVVLATYMVTVPAGKPIRWHAMGIPQMPAQLQESGTIVYVWSATRGVETGDRGGHRRPIVHPRDQPVPIAEMFVGSRVNVLLRSEKMWLPKLNLIAHRPSAVDQQKTDQPKAG